MDNKESKGWGTLLHVMNQEHNDWVSFLKELIEFFLNPSNHLIGIGPKLDGNTLRIKASSWEYTVIFRLNWLTCSTGSVRPLYMANVGYWNRLGSFAFSIPLVKGDLKIWLNAFFITSIPTPLQRAPAFPLVKMLFLTGEGFAWWSSRPLSVYSILFIIGRDIRAERGPLLLCSTKLLLQIINLSLHGFFITLLMSYMTFPSKTASTYVDGVHTAFLIVFPISFTLKIEEFILLTNIGRFHLVRTYLMWTWSCHNHYTILKHKLFPQTTPIVGSRFVVQAQKS